MAAKQECICFGRLTRELTPGECCNLCGAYVTPEGHWLPKRLLLPEARSFADVLEYIGEWKSEWSSSVGKRAEQPPEPRYIMTAPASTAWERKAYRSWPSKGNEIGPYCAADLAQLGGKHHRSLAVRATDAVIEAVSPRIVTPDDHLNFKIIGHADRDRALVILEHGYIIGGHWLAYIDPTTIPSYPFEARDAAYARICESIRSMGDEPYVGDLSDHGKYVHPIPAGQPSMTRQPDRSRRAVIFKDGRVELEFPDKDTSTGEPWKVAIEAP